MYKDMKSAHEAYLIEWVILQNCFPLILLLESTTHTRTPHTHLDIGTEQKTRK